MAIQKKSVAFLSIISVLSSVLGLFFSVVLSRCYGVSRDVEIYFASTSLFFSIAALTQTGAITEIALPIYHQNQEKYGKAIASKLYSQIINWMGLAATVVAVLSAVFSKPIIHVFVPGFSVTDQEKARLFFLLICPLFTLEILRSILGTLLNAEKVFGRTELANIFSQIGNILFVYFFYQSLGVYAAMFGLWFGQVLSFSYSFYLARQTGFRYHFSWTDSRLPLISLFGKIKNTFVYVIATQSYMVGLNAVLSLLPAGHYGVFKYAQLIFSKTQGLLLHPVSTVFFSQFSKEIAAGKGNAGRLIRQCNRLTILTGIAVMLYVYGIGMPSFCLLWLNEKFDLSSISMAFKALLLFYSILFVNGISLIYRKVNMTFGYVRELYLSFTLVQILFTVVMFFWPVSWGIYAIVISLLVNNLFLGVIPPLLIWKKDREMYQPIQGLFFIKSVAMLGLGMAALFVFKRWVYMSLDFTIFGWTGYIIIFTIATSSIFLGLLLVFRIQELTLGFNLIRKYVAKKT